MALASMCSRTIGYPWRPIRFSNPVYGGASILIANENFGSGSSREHAPQALKGWGIAACIAESFSEIFLGNSLAIGCHVRPHLTETSNS